MRDSIGGQGMMGAGGARRKGIIVSSEEDRFFFGLSLAL
jgi:hypothetical protein